MTTSLTALSSALMLYAWQCEPALTYTVQTSPDLQEWTTLPLVISASAALEEVGVEPDAWPFFVRLRYSLNGDTNENGLPDAWEWEHFGAVDIDALADPDLDGKSTLEEWQSGTDPLDYYDGELPLIRISCGREWLVRSGEPSAQALSVSVTHASGEPWTEAPVKLRTGSGSPALLHAGEAGTQAQPELLEWTDSLGRLNPGVNAIHVVGPPQPGQLEWIYIEAGAARERMAIKATSADFGDPPRTLQWNAEANGGLVCSWSGDPGDATAFIVEEQDAAGDWIPLTTVPVAGLPAPDPATRRYQLTCR